MLIIVGQCVDLVEALEHHGSLNISARRGMNYGELLA